MPCPLPSTNRTLGFGSSKLSPCLIDNACALDDHSKVAQTALQHPVPNFRDGFGYIGTVSYTHLTLPTILLV